MSRLDEINEMLDNDGRSSIEMADSTLDPEMPVDTIDELCKAIEMNLGEAYVEPFVRLSCFGIIPQDDEVRKTLVEFFKASGDLVSSYCLIKIIEGGYDVSVPVRSGVL